MAWIIQNQFSRRNLTPFARAELALKLEPLVAKKAKENQEIGLQTSAKRGGKVSQNSVEPIDTQKHLAQTAGISHDTLHKAKVITEKASEEVKQQLRTGEVSINVAYKGETTINNYWGIYGCPLKRMSKDCFAPLISKTRFN